MSFFGKNSLKNLSGCHCDIKVIVKKAIIHTPVDFGISWGKRTPQQQNELFKQRLSRCDGYEKISTHQGEEPEDPNSPSMAFDIFAYVRKKANFTLGNMCLLAGYLDGITIDLFQRELITHRLRWGGNWDMDNEILIDQNFDDLCHHELYKP